MERGDERLSISEIDRRIALPASLRQRAETDAERTSIDAELEALTALRKRKLRLGEARVSAYVVRSGPDGRPADAPV
jgi:hypothetical protein